MSTSRAQIEVPVPSLTFLCTVVPDLDPLGHVNNAVYVDWLEEALAAAGWQPAVNTSSRTLRLEYLASAERGNAVAVELHGGPDAWSARIRRSDGLELVRAAGTAATP